MGLLDITSRILSRYEADVSDHVRGLEKLKGAQREQAQGAIDAGKKTEESLGKQIDSLNKAAFAFTAVTTAAKGARDLVLQYAEHSRIAAGAAGVDIDKLKQATQGLKTNTQLLSDAAKFNAGAFKVSAEQMAIAEKAMLSLSRRGFESAEANKKVLDAVVALKTDGLQDLGIFVDKAGLSMDNAADRARLYERVMAALTSESQRMGNAQLTAAEQAQAAAIKFENAWDRIKNKAGAMIAGMPDAIGAYTREQTRNFARRQLGINMMSEDDYQRRSGAVQDETFVETFRRSAGFVEGMGRVNPAAFGAYAAGRVDVDASPLEALMSNFADAQANYRYATPGSTISWGDPEKAKPLGGGRGSTGGGFTLDALYSTGVSEIAAALIESAVSGTVEMIDDSSRSAIAGGDVAFQGDRMNALLAQAQASLMGTGEATSRGDRYNAFVAKGSKSKLEGMFGPLEEFNAYKMAFDGLSGAVTSAMTAWIDGSMSAGKAIKMFFAEALKGLAIQMAVESLKHLAYAAASAIPGPTFNPAGIGGHVKTAVLFAGVAAAAAAGAKGLGGGGGPTPATGAGAAAPIGGGGGGEMYRGEHRTIIIGDQFSDDSPRKRGRTFRRREQEAYGSVGSVNR